MGLIDKLRAELVDIIEWVDDSRHTLVWRFPRHHNQIKYGAQLIVRPGQMAIFVHQGKVADVFEPGQYKLETKNLPVLSTLAGWLYGFDSPFKAEVYFVGTRQITDLKWGTPNPVMMRDADFGPIRVRAFGTYTLKASHPKTLLSELVGTDWVQFSVDLARRRGMKAGVELSHTWVDKARLRTEFSDCLQRDIHDSLPPWGVAQLQVPREPPNQNHLVVISHRYSFPNPLSNSALFSTSRCRKLNSTSSVATIAGVR